MIRMFLNSSSSQLVAGPRQMCGRSVAEVWHMCGTCVANAWQLIWENICHTAEMAYRVLCRKCCISFVVLWIHTLNGFVCFARQLNVSGNYDRWVESCARELECDAHKSFSMTNKVPVVPTNRRCKRYAGKILNMADRWNLECCDGASQKVMAMVNTARSSDSACIMSIQSPFRSVVSVCFVSFKI